MVEREYGHAAQVPADRSAAGCAWVPAERWPTADRPGVWLGMWSFWL
jgi:hypothetical protein